MTDFCFNGFAFAVRWFFQLLGWKWMAMCFPARFAPLHFCYLLLCAIVIIVFLFVFFFLVFSFLYMKYTSISFSLRKQ